MEWHGWRACVRGKDGIIAACKKCFEFCSGFSVKYQGMVFK